MDEMGVLLDEWKETRSSINRFDNISVDLRKYGFSLITFIITASSIAFEAADLKSAIPFVIVPFAVMILVCGLFLADRYNEILLLASVLRSRQIEDSSQEIIETQTKNSIYLRLNLSSFLEDKVQKASARTYSFLIYLLFIVASFLLGVFSLITYYQQVNIIPPSDYFVVLVILGAIALSFLVVTNLKMADLAANIRRDIFIDDRIIIRKLFSKDDVNKAVSRLASEIHLKYDHDEFLILTIGRGGMQLATKLISEFKKKWGRVNIPSIAVFSKRVQIDEKHYRIEIEPPDKYMLMGKNVLIVDDLVNTGHTLQRLIGICRARNVKTIRSCILLDAPAKRKINSLTIDFGGLLTPETGDFVGAGMDKNDECRELNFIGVIKYYCPKRL